MEKIYGYNIGFKLNEKACVGVTQDDLSIAATTKESITKVDKGNTNYVVVGHGVTFTVAGVVAKNGSDDATLDSDMLFEQSLKKGSDAEIPFVYTRGTLSSYKGVMIITAYSESSGSEDVATYSLSCQVIGDMAKVVESNDE